MSFDTDVAAIPGVLAYWKYTDLAGTSAPDSLNSNAMPMTISGTIAAGPALTNMGGASLRGDGTSTRGATAALAANHPLRFINGAPFTFAGWVQVAATVGTNKSLFGRGNNTHFMRINGLSAVGLGNGVNFPSSTVLPVNEPVFLAFTWDGLEGKLFINGHFSARAFGTPAVSNVSDAFEILAVSANNYIAADVERWFVVSRAMPKGELEKLYLSGAIAPIVMTPNIFAEQSRSTTALRSAVAGYCDTCGADMRALEAAVTIGTTKTHPTCYGYRARALPVVAPSLTTPVLTDTNIGNRAAQTMDDMLQVMTTRPTSNKDQYFNGQQWVITNASVTPPASIAGVAAGAAMLHKLSGADADGSWRRLAMASVYQYIGTQVQTGDFRGTYDAAATPSNDLAANYIFEAFYWLRPTLGRGTQKRWMDSFLFAGEYWVRKEKFHYTNGNVELGSLLHILLLWIITNDPYWGEQYEHQLAQTIAPPSTISGNNSGDNLGKFGWYHVDPGGTTATKGGAITGAADGSGDKGFFAEGKNDPTSFPGWAPGYDPYYTHVQQIFLTRLHYWSKKKFPGGDSRLVPYLNMTLNLLLDKVNKTTAPVTVNAMSIGSWYMDPRTGLDGVVPASRNPTFQSRPFATPAMLYLARNPSLRSTNTLDPNWYQLQWAMNENEQKGAFATMGTYMRGLGEVIGPHLLYSPIWPGDD